MWGGGVDFILFILLTLYFLDLTPFGVYIQSVLLSPLYTVRSYVFPLIKKISNKSRKTENEI